MTPIEAIYSRHSVRQYQDREIPEDILKILSEKVAEINRETGLHVQLITCERKAFQGKMGYGKFTGVSNYFVMAGRKSSELDEQVGYFGEQLVLLAQSLGLNTCWAGLSYSKIPNTYVLEKGETIVCYIALGYGQTQGKNHKVKNQSQVSNAAADSPAWFISGVEAALAAPTAVNQQKFHIDYLGNDSDGLKAKVSIRRFFSVVGYTYVDLGIVRLHFEIGAGMKNFEWI